MNHHNTLRSEVYLLLSEAYKQPTAQFIAEQPTIIEFLTQAFCKLEYDLSSTLYDDWPTIANDLATVAAAYRQSFIFPIDSRIVPVESIYRQWTHDTTAELSFAREKGLLMSDHALHIKTLYDSYGITIPPEYHSMPDHICLELEFAAFLLEQQETEKYLIFIKEHLNWLDELAEAAEKQNIPDYYRQIIKLTAQFLSLELRR
ncbi:Chaperone protein TorD [bioreactor metagenome]|uniref:Chaperone protein TorD n=1 Tax=bioreactor metagenome TaxID=1076179 RepID=A0A644TFN9_9ZZZZ|nr:molecular chaperone TorD family protein [Negativicutes bacterium]